MVVYADCRHYLRRSAGPNDAFERCLIDVADNDALPYSCVPDCLFHERRAIADAGWQQPDPGPER